MELIKIIILGIIEGLTEFIPVSSTGHLVIVESILQLEMKNAESFQIAIQLGAICAVLVTYQTKIKRLIKENQLVDFLKKLIIAALPVFIIGFLAYEYIKTNLFSPVTVACGLIIGSIGMIAAEVTTKNSKQKKVELSDITPLQALGVGLFQVLSLWPGMSRSGATIFGGLFCKMSHKLSADFSFLLALPVISAAVAYDLLKSMHLISMKEGIIILQGAIISFLVAIISIRFFLKILESVKLYPFAIYRIIVAIAVLLFYV